MKFKLIVNYNQISVTASSGLKGKRLVDIFDRQSFDRFGDDLAEKILSYLSIEDKYRLRCVSKHWSQLIASTQTVLKLNDSESKDNFRELFYTVTSGQYRNVDRQQRLAAVLKTFTAIKTIRICDSLFYDDQVLNAISQWCPRLESINIHFDHLSEEAITRFGQRVGQSLKSVEISDKLHQNIKMIAILLQMCPNIESLRYYGSHTAFKRVRPLKTLKKLFIYNPCEGISNAFWLLRSLSLMAPNLQTLQLYGPECIDGLNDQTICQLIAGCPQLNTIELCFLWSDITNKTVDKLIETANNRPKESINFKAIVESSEVKRMLRLDRNDKPRNLSFDIRFD